jgi:hypothetical protein
MDFPGYFVALFVLSSVLPTEKGWLLKPQPHPTLEVCNTVMKAEYIGIMSELRRYLYPATAEIEEIRCLTYQEVVKRNNKIWHSGETEDGPKE